MDEGFRPVDRGEDRKDDAKFSPSCVRKYRDIFVQYQCPEPVVWRRERTTQKNTTTPNGEDHQGDFKNNNKQGRAIGNLLFKRTFQGRNAIGNELTKELQP